MGVVLAFVVGYFVGANAGQETYREVVDSARAVRESPEFQGLVSSFRSHASSTLRQLATMAGGEEPRPFAPDDVVNRVRGMMSRLGGTSRGS